MSIATDTARVQKDFPDARMIPHTGIEYISRGRSVKWWIVHGENDRALGFGPTPGTAWALARKRVTSGRAMMDQ